jgi:glycolate oxidase FAD binding subunit
LRADGTRSRAGGRVVKNVAGYDLMRLLCGSWGSLGLITAVTLRTYPRQAHRAGLLLQGNLAALEQLRRACLAAPLMPQRLDWLTPALVGSEQAGLLLSLVSISQGALEAQLSDLQSEASSAGLSATKLEPDALQALEGAAQGADQLDRDLWLLHLGVPPAAAQTLLQESALQRLACSLAAGCGQGWAWGPANQAPVFTIAALRERCQQLGGQLTVLCQPSTVSGRLPAWSDSPARSVIEAIKRDFDPLQQLSRGRLPGVQAGTT